MKVKVPQYVTDHFVNLPEHGMGYQKVCVLLKDGGELYTTLENCEFLELPDNIGIEDLKRIEYISRS